MIIPRILRWWFVLILLGLTANLHAVPPTPDAQLWACDWRKQDGIGTDSEPTK